MRQVRNIEDYMDILNLPHPEPKAHARMSIEARAAQFAPFAALTGHSEAVCETARLTEKRAELDENMQDILDFRLRKITRERSAKEVSVTYFVPDARKDGGSYVTVSGRILRANLESREILMEDGTRINADDIVWIE